MRHDQNPLEVRGIAARSLTLLSLLALVSGCAIYASDKLDELFGPAEPRERLVANDSTAGASWLNEVKPLVEQRCVVCHGCYDSPCQLNMSAPEGIDRGASKAKVYDSTRLIADPTTRLMEDAQTTAQWREMGFWPVLNEREQTHPANLLASVMHHMLTLKQDNPLPEGPILDDSFDLRLNRDQECPKPEEMDDFAEAHPLWGMPYALPGLAQAEFNTLERWLENGSPMALPLAYGAPTQAAIERWERFLNGDSLKQQLMSRYLFEHWFLAHLHFPETGEGEFFRIFRSTTPPGEPIDLVATRRPYDDPGVERVYYRLWRDHTTVLDKTHMPYALDAKRMAWLSALFLEPEYSVEARPSYTPEVAANPFIVYEAIPVESRWRFLLQEAQFTVMNFIKGPVCRGQIALDVIRDHFWVFFTRPDIGHSEEASAFLTKQQHHLSIPTQAGSNALPIATWLKYSKSQEAYLKAKSDLMGALFPKGEYLTPARIWDGDGYNQNAALTVFRHFDSASVVKGLIGPAPKTAWLIDYPILERIHYLLVAGFDIYGNLGHQLTARLYMDFLRMEGEFNFLALLPPENRISERDAWYEGASNKQRSYIYGSRANFEPAPSIEYQTDNPKLELYGLLQQRLAPVLNHSFDLGQASVPASHREALQGMQTITGLPVVPIPQLVYLEVLAENGDGHFYTILHNTGHSNITSVFMESNNLKPEDDDLTIVKGFIGSYPGAYWQVAERDLPLLVEQMARLGDEASYRALMDRYGVRRTAPDFWQHSDSVITAHHSADPLANGLLDYNRLENR